MGSSEMSEVKGFAEFWTEIFVHHGGEAPIDDFRR